MKKVSIAIEFGYRYIEWLKTKSKIKDNVEEMYKSVQNFEARLMDETFEIAAAFGGREKELFGHLLNGSLKKN